MADNDADGPPVADEPTSLEDAESQAVRAALYAEAARARVRAMRLDVQAEADVHPESGTDAGATGTAAPRIRLRRPSRHAVGLLAVVVVVAACLAAGGYPLWQHYVLVSERQRSADFAAAARRAVVTLMSIDPDHAKENVQRMIDDTTGQLQSQLRVSSVSLVDQAREAKVVTKATVEEVAVQSMTDDSAVVLVAATSTTTNPDKTPRPPGRWRLSVHLERENGQLKMSKIVFLQ